MKNVSGILSFNTGIERVIEGEGPESARLPDSATLLPSEEAVDGKLESALFTPSLDDRLLAWQRPRVNDRNILVPDRFHAMIHEAREAMSEASARAKTREDRNAFGGAADVLSEETELAGVLFTYRNMLHKA